MEAEGLLESQRGVNDTLLGSMDRTQSFSTPQISCPHCTQRQHEETIRYSHSVLAPVLGAPGSAVVSRLAPEFIGPQAGAEKQACEQNAFKRWGERNAQRLPDDPVTLLADDLPSRQPPCELCLAPHLKFLVVCRPESHAALDQEVAVLARIDGVTHREVRHHNGRFSERQRYRYLNQGPLRSGAAALLVTWCEVEIVCEKTGERLYFNQFVTNHALDDESVIQVVASGRAHGKTENEHHNPLKTAGYPLAHTFGPGQQCLAAVLLSLNLLAFLLPTLLAQTAPIYQQVRQELATRRTFCNDIRTLTHYLIFARWHPLLLFMCGQLALDHKLQPPSSTSN